MEDVKLYLPIIIPVVALNLVLIIVSLRDLIKHPKRGTGQTLLWAVVIFCIQIFGPIAYLTFGRDKR